MKSTLGFLFLFLFCSQVSAITCTLTTEPTLKAIGSKGTRVNIILKHDNNEIAVFDAISGKKIDPDKTFSRRNREIFTLEDGREISRSLDESETYEWHLSDRKKFIKDLIFSQKGLNGIGSRGTPVIIHIGQYKDIMVINLKTGKEIYADSVLLSRFRETFTLVDGRQVLLKSTYSDAYEWVIQ